MTAAAPIGQTGSVQRKLVLDDAPALVLATVSDARAQLPGHDEDDILSLIEEGALLYAWDISLRPGKVARELRIFPPCIEHYRRTGGRRPYNPSIDQIIALLLSAPSATSCKIPKPFFSGNTIRLLLNCGSTHITNLVDAKVLRCLPINPLLHHSTTPVLYRRGPNGAAMIQRDSFIAFLKSRLEGAC